MPNISYVNGRYVHQHDAKIACHDRGFLFADGVYEVIEVRNGVMIDGMAHFERLLRSLDSIQIKDALSYGILSVILKQLVHRNRRKNGYLYIHITRGAAPRSHEFPKKRVKPSVYVSYMLPKGPSVQEVKAGVSAITLPDMRWQRRDIKSTSLLSNVLAKEQAVKKGCKDAILYDDHNHVTEGGATNIFLVDSDKILYTHPTTEKILGGITRARVIELAKQSGFKVKEKSFTLDQLITAKELFLTSTTNGVLAITKVDDKPIANGQVGEVAQKCRDLYNDFIEKSV